MEQFNWVSPPERADREPEAIRHLAVIGPWLLKPSVRGQGNLV
jgi:hypothetical protein